MRLVSSAIRLAAALAFAGGLSFFAPHGNVRADEAMPMPFDAASIDRTKNACTDFFGFATAKWRAAHPIPPAYREYGYIEALIDHTRDLVRSTLEDAQKNPGEPGGNTQKIGALYGTCMDTSAIERAGLRPLQPELARIDAIRSRGELTALLAHLHDVGVDAGFSLSPTQDFRDSTKVIAEIDQSGIGLPERDYYLRPDKESRAVRTQYLTHVRKMLALAGDTAAASDAAAIVAFETALAKGSRPAAALRDPLAVYHPMKVPAVSALMPSVDVPAYFRANRIPTTGIVNVAEPEFLQTFQRAVATAPLSTWRAYLRWRVLDANAAILPKRFDDENFAFRGRILNGQKQQLPRWKRCVEVDNALLGEAVGQAYVAKTFPPEAKQRALDMSQRIRDAYGAEMAALPWMSPATKRVAQAKLTAMGLKVGYPAKWRSYAGFAVTSDDYFGNIQRGRAFERAYQLAQIGKPVDRNRWGMNPQTVNAYNDVQRNEIVLPAAQLQPPFFDANADDAANLGATGAGTVGHEMTHGFDDEGHKFDAHGNVRNWWTKQDLHAFEKQASCVVKQFDKTVAVGNVHYQGKLVAGEAIADLGGVVIGYRALQSSLAGKPHDAIEGFTPEQRYFVAFAQSWTESVRPEAARNQALTDPHPIPRDRVNQTLLNVPEWYTAFNCPKPPKPVCAPW